MLRNWPCNGSTCRPRWRWLPDVEPGAVLPDEVRAAISLVEQLPSRVRDRTAAVALSHG